MDMMISSRKDRIITSLYENLVNLYLYILPHSNHPLGVLTGLVSDNILRVHLLCSNEDDINCRIKELYARLIVRGYQRDLLITELTKSITGACAFIKRGSV